MKTSSHSPWSCKFVTLKLVLAGMKSQSQNVVQVPAAFRNFTMPQKKKTLDELVQDKWFCYIEDGKIGLGVRSCLDLRSWFCNLDVRSCEVCNEAALKAVFNCFFAALLSRSD
ncbi:hypothetical protein Patl1_04974 [Pistacia atlantica]|uniref:Uncharacterized protein n=1 Tax=Pistacia atlantica TaxID=434234 RepID=A0ACC1BWZ2_9ROSI|nr:hypothetical protein Patl1_04974 [Pistacia atlantica]